MLQKNKLKSIDLFEDDKNHPQKDRNASKVDSRVY